jgi:lysophospholipase L1-like esterase
MNRTASTPVRFFAQLAVMGAFLILPLACGGGGGNNPAPLVAPTITAQPQNVTVTEGNAASFSVTAEGSAPLSYQWKKGGVDISGATSRTYTIAATALTDTAATFTVTVNNSVGSATSNAATLTVNPGLHPPTITTPPANQTVYAGQPATFSVVATTATGTLTYQWSRDGVAIPVDGIGASFTTLPTTLLDDGAKFTVAVTNGDGTTTSSEVTLTLKNAFQVNAANVTSTNYTFIPANDPNFYYTGRIDNATATAPILIWSGTTVKAKFHGTSLALQFSPKSGTTYFDVIVDDELRMLSATAAANSTYLWDGDLADTDHDLTIFKRTEAMFSYCAFQGIYIDKAETALGTKPAAAAKRIEFYGDSITAGACDEVWPYNDDGSTYNAAGYSSHNNYTTYGAITARTIGADYVCIACSGIGISVSWNQPTMPDIYDRLYYYDVAPGTPQLAGAQNQFDLTTAVPNIVVINLGVNDQGKSSNAGTPFPATYASRFETLVQNLRAAYPNAAIVLALGGLHTGTDNGQAAALTTAYAEVCTYFAAGGAGADANVYSFTLQAANSQNEGIHPRDYTHQLLAGELVAFLQSKSLVP